jgi:hypothetical protein
MYVSRPRAREMEEFEAVVGGLLIGFEEVNHHA